LQTQTAESNLKRSLALIGRPRPESVRIKISESSKGKKMSAEACLKMSLSKKQLYKEHPELILSGERAYWHINQFSQQHREKISKAGRGRQGAMLGKKHSEKTKEKMSIKHQGIKLSDEHRRKLSLSKLGERNPSWVNGLSFEPYTKEWMDKAFKKSIMDRDNYQCRNSLCTGNCKSLGIHHINYNKKDCSERNLITLCQSCNSRANFNRAEWEHHYSGIMEVIYNG